jgi:hypothetical protein
MPADRSDPPVGWISKILPDLESTKKRVIPDLQSGEITRKHS